MTFVMILHFTSLESIQYTFLEYLPLGRYTVLVAFENTMIYKEELVGGLLKSFFEIKWYNDVTLELSSVGGHRL